MTSYSGKDVLIFTKEQATATATTAAAAAHPPFLPFLPRLVLLLGVRTVHCL